jgi:hypothetical protein
MQHTRRLVLFPFLVMACSGDIRPANTSTETGDELCADQQDNDSDGLVDCQDPDCAGYGGCSGIPPPFSDGGAVPSTWTDGGGKAWTTCATTQGIAEAKGGGVDMIWFIDTSGSMTAETVWVQQNLNAFAQYIGTQNIDYRVILIGRKSGTSALKVCVPPPLAGPNCSDGARFRHVDQYVNSHDGLDQTINTYPKWQDFLRKDATKNFIAVTDDNAAKSAAWFKDALAKLTNPGFSAGFVYHSIVAYGDVPTKGCDTGAKTGQIYLELTAETKGFQFKICEKDWSSGFSSLAQGVAASAKPPCSYTLPDPGGGKEINPNYALVSYTNDSGKLVYMTKTDGKDQCSSSSLGWYFDNPSKPTQVILCPDTCSALDGGKIFIDFGCLADIDP